MIRDLALEVKSYPRHLRLTLRTLADHLNRTRLVAGEPAFVWPSAQLVADRAGLSLRTVYRHLAELVGAGAIARAVRVVGGALRHGWDLVMGRAPELAAGLPDLSSMAQTSVTGDSALPLQEPEANLHTARGRADGVMVGADPPRNPAPAAPVCAATRASQPREQRNSGGATTAASRRKSEPRTADEVRAHALWLAYEAHRCRLLGGKAHRGEPRHRDLTRIVALVEHVERTRCRDDRESAWSEVARYGAEAVDIADRTTEPGTRRRDQLEQWRSDGWEWGPDRFDRVMQDVASDVHGKAEDAWWEARRVEQQQRRAEDAAQPKMSAAAISDFVAQLLGMTEPAAHGQAAPV